MLTDIQAQYNVKWSWRLLLLNAGLVVIFTWNGFIDDYLHLSVGDWWLVPLVPGVLTLSAWASARSLPGPWRTSLNIAALLGLLLTLLTTFLSFYASHFMSGKW